MASPRPIAKPWRVLTAAAQQIKVNVKGQTAAPKREQWQTDAWDMADLIPEVGQAATFMANVVSGIKLYVGVRPDNDGEVPALAEASTPGAAAAGDLLRRMRDGSATGGMAGLLYLSTWNLKIPGEYYLLSEPAMPGDLITGRGARMERWDVRSIDEIDDSRSKGFVYVKDRPGGQERKLSLPPEDPSADIPDDAVFLWRVWDRHPRYSGLARSSLRAALNQCDELLLLGKAVRVAVRRFLAGNGMLVLPSELDLPGNPTAGDEGEDPELSSLMRKMGEATMNAMLDEANMDSLLPLLMMGPGELLEKLQHIKFYGALDAELRELIDMTRRRLLDGLDLPPEQVTGVSKTSHWNAWQIDASTWARYGEPTARLTVSSWTEGLWPMLYEAPYNVAPRDAAKLCYWFDPAAAIMDPDESKTADELLEHGAIGWEAYRRRKGANEDEAPTPEELQQMADLGILRGRGTAGGPVPNNGAMPAGDSTTASANGNGWHPLPPVRTITAGARNDLGRRLMEIDRTLRARLEEGAEAAVGRALSRAGAIVRNRAQGDANLTAALAGVPAHRVIPTLGRSVVAALLANGTATEDDLLAGGVDDFEARFLSLTAAAQARTLALLAVEFDLDDDERDAFEQQQDRNRAEAWAWLAGALLTLARQRMHDPTPGAPAAGEHTASATVPTGTVREAMARAGGGVRSSTAPGPMGGVAAGEDVFALLGRLGALIESWEWAYGDSERSFPAHLDLDGVQFTTWSDDVLTVRLGDEWLGVSHYAPGDHAGCACSAIPMVSERTEAMVDA